MRTVAARLSHHFLRLAAVLALSAGCTTLGVPDPPVADVAPQRHDRNDAVVREFESKRDLAELQAALALWNQGDSAACEESLRQLLRRNPNHREARLLLAEALLANGRPDAAFQQIGDALATWPGDAQVQYTAALLLESAGQPNPALAHYRRAVELEPANEIYSIAYQTALLDAPQPTLSPNAPPPGSAIAEDTSSAKAIPGQ